MAAWSWLEGLFRRCFYSTDIAYKAAKCVSLCFNSIVLSPKTRFANAPPKAQMAPYSSRRARMFQTAFARNTRLLPGKVRPRLTPTAAEQPVVVGQRQHGVVHRCSFGRRACIASASVRPRPGYWPGASPRAPAGTPARSRSRVGAGCGSASRGTPRCGRPVPRVVSAS